MAASVKTALVSEAEFRRRPACEHGERWTKWDTSADEVLKAEKLLGLASGALSSKYGAMELHAPQSARHCQCGREYSWLDVISTAKKVHSSAFLSRFLLGDYFMVSTPTKLNCAECGARSVVDI
eukprot:g58110.t1